MGVVDYLKSQKQDSSFSSRTKLAWNFWIKNYRGTADQNIQLEKYLKSKSNPQPTTPVSNNITQPKEKKSNIFNYGQNQKKNFTPAQPKNDWVRTWMKVKNIDNAGKQKLDNQLKDLWYDDNSIKD